MERNPEPNLWNKFKWTDFWQNPNLYDLWKTLIIWMKPRLVEITNRQITGFTGWKTASIAKGSRERENIFNHSSHGPDIALHKNPKWAKVGKNETHENMNFSKTSVESNALQIRNFSKFFGIAQKIHFRIRSYVFPNNSEVEMRSLPTRNTRIISPKFF